MKEEEEKTMTVMMMMMMIIIIINNLTSHWQHIHETGSMYIKGQHIGLIS
jgi:hypothetical protein